MDEDALIPLIPLEPLEDPEEQGTELLLDAYPSWNAVKNLPLRVTVQIAMPGFRVSDLQNLSAGQVLTSESPAAEHVPLSAGGALIAWAEFDSVDGIMAVRITRGA